MKISLILTSYDRQGELDRFAEALASQTFDGAVEVVFSAQGPAQLRVLGCASRDVSMKVRDCGGRVSLSAARNRAVDAASGDIIGFPDDDCWYPPDLLKKVASYFDANPDVDCICTNVFDPERRLSYGRRPVGVICGVSFLNLFKLPISVGIFVRRRAFLAVGGRFCEALGAGTEIGSGEETELVARLLRDSFTVRYVGTMQVYHAVPINGGSDAAKNYKYGIGFGCLNSYLVRQRHWGVIPHLAEVLLRSCAGVFLYIFSPIQRSVYWNRIKGILRGLLRTVELGQAVLPN